MSVVEGVRAPNRPRRQRGGGLFRGIRRPEALAGIFIVVLVFAAGIAAPLLTPYSPYDQVFDQFLPPSLQHPIGTDEFGRDLFARVLFGIRQDVIVCLVAVPIGASIGVLLGIVGGSWRWLDVVLQRGFDVALAFTGLVAGVTVAAIIGPGLLAVVITVIVVDIPLFGRLTRSAVHSQRGRDYVTAARLVGGSKRRQLFRHVLPNSLDPLVVQGALSLSAAVFIEGAMSFVGIGVRLPEPSLGGLLRSSINFLYQSPAYAIAPMIVLTLLVLSFNLIADGLNKGLLRR